MKTDVLNGAAGALASAARPLTGAANDYDALLELIGDRQVVLIGEATHGTHEFYRERAEITKRLIIEKGFSAVAAEADWPDAYRVNQYARGVGLDEDATEALNGFKRFPQWMWRNAVVLDFVGWLRDYNERRGASEQVGFYGLDLYSMHASAEAVIAYLDKVDPAAATRARVHYSCLDRFGTDTQSYGLATSLGMAPSCERYVIAELIALHRSRMDYLSRNGQVADDEFFSAEQNARVVRDAEEYYRHMFRREFSSWNLRDTHMMETLVSLHTHLAKTRSCAKIVVWAHNSHLGDARATEVRQRGELNLGQLVREHFNRECFLLGQTTFDGTVTAASEWDGPAERKIVRPALEDSYEALLHETWCPKFWLSLGADTSLLADSHALDAERLERAIGVIYKPETELASHYFNARITEQFDAVLHTDHTRAVEPLERTVQWEEGEVDETFPSGL